MYKAAFLGMASAVSLLSNQDKLYLQMHASFVDDADEMLRDNSNVQLSAERIIEGGDDWPHWGAKRRTVCRRPVRRASGRLSRRRHRVPVRRGHAWQRRWGR